MKAEEAYALSRKYTEDTIEGAGAVAGKPCQIQSIVDNPDGTHTITFLWVDNSDVSHTSELIVRDGEDGADGVSPSVSVTTITGGHKVTITDAEGSHAFNVMDGEKGEQGEPGQDGAKGDKGDPGDDGADGEDGFSPIITVKTDTTNTYILHIVTADDEFDTPNLKGSGGGGGTSDYEDLTNKPKIEGHTLESGNQTAASLGIASLDVTGALDTRVTALEENPVNPFQFDTMPEATDHPQEVIEYIGADTVNYKRGYFYRSTPVVVSGELTYVWQQQDTQPSNSNYEDMQNKPQINGVTLVGDKASSDLALQDEMQFATLPEASASLLGKIYQYTGANTASYKKGFFYQCVYDSENNVYVWQNTDVSDNAVLAGRVTTLETNQGDMSHLEVTGVVDLVSAINKVNARAGIERYAYVEPVLTIYYNDGSTFSISVGDILSETQIGELANVLDTTITDGQVLQYDAALQKYKPYAILTALQTCLQTAKDYTDQEISSAIVSGAYVCDEKPSYDAEHDTVIYKQSGVTKTTTQTDARFYYYSDGDPYCTSWIDDIEFTFSVADVDFEDYVNKNTDVVSTYTEDMLDKTKIPDVAALDALLAIVKTSLALKVNTSDIIDVLTSSDATKPLSAKQGKVLKDTVDTKQDIIQYATMPVADQPYLGKVAQYSGTTSGAYIKGQTYTCKYDNLNDVYYWDVVPMTADLGTLADGETKPVSGDEIYDALALKQNATMSAPVETETTVEGALGALSSNKQPKTLSTTIEGETTVEGCLTALSNKSVGVDGTTIVKDSITGELSAVTATNNSVGVVKPDGTTITVDANGVISGANTLDFDTDDFDVVDDEVSLDASQKIKTFTQAGWNALSSAEKIALAGQNVIISDDGETGDVVDVVEYGNMNPVTSNAVYDAVAKKMDERIRLASDIGQPLTIPTTYTDEQLRGIYRVILSAPVQDSKKWNIGYAVLWIIDSSNTTSIDFQSVAVNSSFTCTVSSSAHRVIDYTVPSGYNGRIQLEKIGIL